MLNVLIEFFSFEEYVNYKRVSWLTLGEKWEIFWEINIILKQMYSIMLES